MTVALPELDTDLELLVGDMPATPCESPHHLSSDSHDGGPATHYMLIGHQCYGPVGEVNRGLRGL